MSNDPDRWHATLKRESRWGWWIEYHRGRGLLEGDTHFCWGSRERAERRARRGVAKRQRREDARQVVEVWP